MEAAKQSCQKHGLEAFEFQLFPSPLVGPWKGHLSLHAPVSSVEERITPTSQVVY